MSAVSASTASGVRSRRPGNPYVLLLIVTGVMLTIGLLMILSASSVEAYRKYGSSFRFFNKQLIGAALGIVVMLILARSDYRKLRRFIGPLLFISIGLLVAVLIPGIGVVRGGSSRWLALGPLSLQPSELAKLTIVLYCAHICERKARDIFELREMIVPIIPVVGVVGLLVILQPDLGTAIICLGCAFIVLYISGARGRHLGLLAGMGSLGLFVMAVSASYRRDRLFSFLNPWADPLDTGYHSIQGQIALGSGGLFGVGPGQSRQKWSYVPNAHTDFIYAIIGEEMGLAGTLFVLLVFAAFLYVGVRIARRAPDRFGMLVAGGITGWITLQAVINMATVAGLLPITGVPLPLISFGGSSLVFTLAGIGVLLSVARQARA